MKRDKVLAVRNMVKNDTVKCNLFDMPSELFMADFQAFKVGKRTVTFNEYQQQRGNYEFLKEFNALNQNSPFVTIVNSCQDEVTVNKGFLGLEDQDDLEPEGQEKFSFLADDTFDSQFDFSDPASLMLRQKKVLKAIEDREKEK